MNRWLSKAGGAIEQLELTTVPESVQSPATSGTGGGAQPLPAQASQQLRAAPMQAVPSGGGRQALASRAILHRVRPLALVRQHDTAPGRPQIEFAAHRTTTFAQPGLDSAVRAVAWCSACAARRTAPSRTGN